MKVGVMVEGQGEIPALRLILGRVRQASAYDLMERPFRADMQPRANAKVIVRQATRVAELLISRGAEKIVVLIDREVEDVCPAAFSRELKEVFHEQLGAEGTTFAVVVKNRKVENWLIADPAGLRTLRQRFNVDQRVERAVSPNRADGVEDAEALLKSMCIGNKGYNKGTDPERICAVMDPLRAAENSRSFRKFMHELGVLAYRTQSALPSSVAEVRDRRGHAARRS